jgi:predicted HicB family RNase H-like nuclease
MAVAEQAVSPRKKTGRSTKPVRVESSIAAKAEAIAIDRGIDTAEYVSEVLRAPVERDWLKLVKRAADAESAGG